MIQKGKLPPMSIEEYCQFIDLQLKHIGEMLKDVLRGAVEEAKKSEDGVRNVGHRHCSCVLAAIDNQESEHRQS